MSSMPQTRAPVGTTGLKEGECSQGYCDQTLLVVIAEGGGELRAFCRRGCKAIWEVSSGCLTLPKWLSCAGFLYAILSNRL